MKKWIPFIAMIPILLVILIVFRGGKGTPENKIVKGESKEKRKSKGHKEKKTTKNPEGHKKEKKEEKEEESKAPASTFTLDIPEISEEEIEEYYEPPMEKDEIISEDDFNEIKESFLYENPAKKGKYAVNRNFRGVLKSQYDGSLGDKVMELNGYVIYKSPKEFDKESAWKTEKKSGPLVYNRINNRMGIVTGKILVTLKKETDIRPLLEKYNLKIESKFEMADVFYLSEKQQKLGPKELSRQLGMEKDVKKVNIEIIDSLDRF